jgi:hypothetical protein
MDPLNLKTASTYINNLLLTRGLLRNGKPIEFARPHKADGGTDATMAEIINLVHDMILRRDVSLRHYINIQSLTRVPQREQEQRDRLSDHLRASRAEATQLTATATRHAAAVATAERAAAAAEAQVRAARAAAARAEAAAKGLRDEAAKARHALARARAGAAADVRRRDGAMQRLKAHLAGQQRGAAPRGAGTLVVGGPGGSVTMVGGSRGGGGGGETDEEAERRAEEALRRETAEFLTKLGQTLSDENDGLVGLVRGALAALREMQGLPQRGGNTSAREDGAAEHDDDDDDDDNRHSATHEPPASVDALTTEMEALLGGLRSLLTSPDFVSVEEVTARDEEIGKLRAGWDRMEVKWREAIHLMDGWRRRMADGGGIDLADIKRGLGLGRDLDLGDVGVPVDDDSSEDEADAASDASSTGPSIDDMVLDFSAGSSAPTEPDLDIVGPPPVSRAMLEISGIDDRGSPRKVTFTADDRHRRHALGTGAAVGGAAPSYGSNGATAATGKAPAAAGLDVGKARATKKPTSSSPRLTVQEKLNVVQAEAEAAAVAAGLRLEDLPVPVLPPPAVAEKKPAGVRKTRVSGRPRRRKSTLTPDELERLMMYN